jgi:hypothetical protein
MTALTNSNSVNCAETRFYGDEKIKDIRGRKVKPKPIREPVLLSRETMNYLTVRADAKKYDCRHIPGIDNMGLGVLRPVLKHQYNCFSRKVPAFFRCELYSFERSPDKPSVYVCDVDVSRRDYIKLQTESDYLSSFVDKIKD